MIIACFSFNALTMHVQGMNVLCPAFEMFLLKCIVQRNSIEKHSPEVEAVSVCWSFLKKRLIFVLSNGLCDKGWEENTFYSIQAEKGNLVSSLTLSFEEMKALSL